MPETSPPIGEAQTEPTEAQCPMVIKPPVEGGSNRDWWPKKLDLTALRLHKALYPIWKNDPGWKGVFTTVNNNTIGNMFILGAAGMFLAGGILAMLIRAQLASPGSAFMGPEVYNQIFTMHGSIMMFLFAIPMFEGLAMYLLPKMLGSRDLAYPRLSALGWWCYLFGGIILIVALLAPATGIWVDGE